MNLRVHDRAHLAVRRAAPRWTARSLATGLSLAAIVLAPRSLWAEPKRVGCAETIETDRPGATNYFNAVGVACLQIETASQLSRQSRQTTQSFPTAIRLGFLESLELRFESSLLGIQYGGATERNDIAFGIKKRLMQPGGEMEMVRPGLGYTLVAVVPGNAGVRDLGPRFDLLADWSLPANFALSINGGLAWLKGEGPNREVSLPLAVVLSATVPETDDKLGLFVDSGATWSFSNAPDADSWTQGAGAGMVYYPIPKVQLDFSGFYDIAGSERGWWFAAGVSMSLDL